MKTLFNFKTLLITVFICNLQFTIINQKPFNLYAQDPQLFEHTWYFVNGVYNGDEFFPVSNLQGELSFTIDDFTVIHSYCEEGGGGSIVEYQNDSFMLEDFFTVLVGVCGQPEEIEFMHNHYSIYGDYADTGIANNPFTYNIESVEDYLQLTIENGEGDFAVYNSMLLSTPSFNQNSISIYPNPVNETIYINQTNHQKVKTTIYDMSGKKIQSHTLENNVSAFDIKSLNQGLYFVIFQSEAGEWVSKKFVKK